MVTRRIAIAAALLGSALGLSGCADGRRYGGISTGYGYADNGYYDGYGGSGYSGWYGDYFYPGTGIYVYDRYRRPFRWNNDQRRYWEGRRGGYRGRGYADNWNGFDRGGFDRGYRYPNRDAVVTRGDRRYDGHLAPRGDAYRGNGYPSRDAYRGGEASRDGARPEAWRWRDRPAGSPAVGEAAPGQPGYRQPGERGPTGERGPGGWRGGWGRGRPQ